jgi:hypothetical protein
LNESYNSIIFLLDSTKVNSEFDTTRFRNLKDILGLYKKLLELSSLYKFEPKIYYFGEPSPLYILLNQEIPYYISLYDSSSVNAQLKLIKWIDKNSNTLIIDKSFVSFDGVPNNIRSVKLIQYLVNNFVIEERVGNHYIAIKKKPNFTEGYLNHWIEIFGNAINVNKLYTPSNIPCSTRYIDLFDNNLNNNLKIYKFGQYEFKIIFSSSYKKFGYLCMPLDNLWFNP